MPEDEVVQTTGHQVNRALTGPSWSDEDRPGYCTLLSTHADWDSLNDRADSATQTFVADTDFDRSVLLYVESVGPNSGYDEIVFEDIEVTDGVLSGTATAVEASGEGFYADVITYPAALLRVTADPLPSAARMTVTDGWDRTTVLDSETHRTDRE